MRTGDLILYDSAVMGTIAGSLVLFQKDNDYLVYAYGQTQPIGGRPELGTGICSRTASISDAQADLLVLGEGQDWSRPNLRSFLFCCLALETFFKISLKLLVVVEVGPVLV